MVQTLIKPKMPKVKGRANVAFILDVSGSMQDCIENLKANLLDLSGQISTISTEQYGVAEPDISYNVLGYRDLTTNEPEEYKIVKMGNDFTSDLDKIKNFFSDEKMQAVGGGDEPESALDALFIATKEMNWEKGKLHIIILFTDASTKKKLHPTTTDGTALDEESSMNVLFEELASKKIKLMIFGPKGISEYNRITKLDNCEYKEMENGEDTLKNFKDEFLFKEEIVKEIAMTVSQSVSTAVFIP